MVDLTSTKKQNPSYSRQDWDLYSLYCSLSIFEDDSITQLDRQHNISIVSFDIRFIFPWTLEPHE